MVFPRVGAEDELAAWATLAETWIVFACFFAFRRGCNGADTSPHHKGTEAFSFKVT
jgi:hypothetical protein